MKGAPREHSPDAVWTAEAARAALFAGEVRGVQLRYAHDGALWCDTVTRASEGEGYLLVRMQLPTALPA